MSNVDRGKYGDTSDAISGVSLPENPSKEDVRAAVEQFKQRGICGRRVGEQHIGPYLMASPEHGRREFDLLEAVLEDVYGNTDFCIRDRSSECSRFRGGCKGDR